MNIHQSNFSNTKTAQHINDIGAVSVGINHIEKHQLKSYFTLQKGKKVVCFVGQDNLLKYAFSIVDKKINQMNKFDLGTLRAKWLGEKSKMNFLPRHIKESSSISQFNNKIDDFIIADQKSKNKIVKNPNFPDNTYIYKNKRGKEFKIVTMGGTAINITCDNNYITGHQKAAIQRAINENRLNKFKEFSPQSSNSIRVINNTSNQVNEIINTNSLEGELMPSLLEQKDIIDFNFSLLKNFEINTTPKNKELVSALALLKLFINDIEISTEDLEYCLSDENLVLNLFKGIKSNTEKELKNNPDYSIEIKNIIQTLQYVFIGRLNIPYPQEKTSEDEIFTSDNIDIGDDIFEKSVNQGPSKEELMEAAMNAIKKNGAHSYSGKTQANTRL